MQTYCRDKTVIEKSLSITHSFLSQCFYIVGWSNIKTTCVELLLEMYAIFIAPNDVNR